MAQDYAKRFVTKDGNARISIYREEYPCDPRGNTDFPLHCEDWHRSYSIMTSKERESKSKSARDLLAYVLVNYGDYKKIIDELVVNGKRLENKEKCPHGTALLYDRHLRAWVVIGDVNCYFGSKREDGWFNYATLDNRKYDLDLYNIAEEATDDTIEYLIEHCMTDRVKLASYSFGYYGEISFSDGVDCEADGIAWLEKDEIIKYCGHTEEFWRKNKFTDIDWVHTEIEAWADNEVYGFVVEERIEYKVHKEYTNVEREAEDSVEEEWEEKDSCWGYYGELDDEHIGYILEGAGFKREELEEVD